MKVELPKCGQCTRDVEVEDAVLCDACSFEEDEARDVPAYDADRVNTYLDMLARVERGEIERWRATEYFRQMTGVDMNEIARRRRAK